MNDYIWTPSGTDITERWRRLGWVPPSETNAYQQKWSSYKELPLRPLTDEQRIAVKQIMSDNVISYPGGRR
ncbi:MAG: hypothetical protein RL563_2692 [Pseudomonadota bacterium]|jgi:hypothetical protein